MYVDREGSPPGELKMREGSPPGELKMDGWILHLLKKFREYEKEYMGDRHDKLEWRSAFMDFILWLVAP